MRLQASRADLEAQGSEIRLVRKDEQIVPVLGFDLGGSCWAFGATVVGSQNRISNDPKLINIVWRRRGALACALLNTREDKEYERDFATDLQILSAVLFFSGYCVCDFCGERFSAIFRASEL